MRGKDNQIIKQQQELGITPAYAGKRYCLKDRLTRSEDHPRLCGEKSGKHLHRQAMSGSPPPMRGKDHTTHRCTV